MLETKEQKQIFAGCLALIVILGLISFFNKPNFTYKETPQTAKKPFDYNAYLASIKIDPKASQKLYEQIISEEEVRKDMETALQVNQSVVLPIIEDATIKLSKQSGQQPVLDYMKSVALIVQSLEDKVQPSSDIILDPNADPAATDKLIAQVSGLLDQYYQTPVPEEAAVFHKSHLASLDTFVDLLRVSKSYQMDNSADPWPMLYRDYDIINQEMVTMGQEYQRLDQKYSINQNLQQEEQQYANGSIFVKRADAFLGFTLTIDIFRKAQEILKSALANAFAQFAASFFNRIITKIESNYKIANFLYYTDALVSGQYVDDYLDKYVKDNLDKAMVKSFIPQISCGISDPALKQVFRAKADQYLGFDPQAVSPNDPNYYAKMARIGDFLATPSGWQLYYQDLADQAQAKAEDAATKELLSQGLKASRDTAQKGQISTAVASSLSSLRGAINSFFNLGVANASSPISRIASAAVQTFINSFVFKGAVFKEQNVCIAVPQIQPVLPGPDTAIPPEPPAPTEQQVEQQYQTGQ